MGVKERLGNTASSLGFTIIPITGDGNFFFTVAAFQVLRILMSPSSPERFVHHLRSIGINNQCNVQELSHRLRQLVVEEWEKLLKNMCHSLKI